jgi:hypothetical protein
MNENIQDSLTTISVIRIVNLFGRYTYTLPFPVNKNRNDRITMIYGDNGRYF